MNEAAKVRQTLRSTRKIMTAPGHLTGYRHQPRKTVLRTVAKFRASRAQGGCFARLVSEMALEG